MFLWRTLFEWRTISHALETRNAVDAKHFGQSFVSNDDRVMHILRRALQFPHPAALDPGIQRFELRDIESDAAAEGRGVHGLKIKAAVLDLQAGKALGVAVIKAAVGREHGILRGG